MMRITVCSGISCGEMRGRYTGDAQGWVVTRGRLARITVCSRISCTGDAREMRGRCTGDAREMRGRYRGLLLRDDASKLRRHPPLLPLLLLLLLLGPTHERPCRLR